jgi:hypothetical protein
MTTFDAIFWETGGRREQIATYSARSFMEAANQAVADAEAWAREHGTRWVLMELADGRVNSEECLGRISIFGEEAEFAGK